MSGPGAHEAFVGLGANLGDRAGALRAAVARLAAEPGVRVTAVSPVYETAAHTLDPSERQPDYLNAVAALRTALSPEALLDVLLETERGAGRRRGPDARPWAPRPLDLDLLLYDAERRETPRLVLPHPRLGARRFVLQPLADLAPDREVPPPWSAPVHTLLARCPDAAPVRRTAIRLR